MRGTPQQHGLTLGIAALLLAGTVPAVAQEVTVRSGQSLQLRGFLSGTLFLQDALFGLGNGQQAAFVNEERSEWWHGGDVRNARVALVFTGGRMTGGWEAGATLEIDFFGPFSGTGNFADEQPQPRLRLAFVDVTKNGTRFRAGQDWSLLLGTIPMSVAHIGFPLGWGSGGFIGWRFPGVWLRHALSGEGAATEAALQLAVMRGSWSDEPAPDQPSAGEAGTPQFEGRLDVNGALRDGASWNAYLVGHWDRKDLAGVADEEDAPDDALDSWALQVGGAVRPGRLTVQGNAYTGKAMAHQFAHIVQFGDIRGWGAWAQLGFDLTEQWSLWGYAGVDDPDDADVAGAEAERLRSWLIVPMLRFASEPVSVGLEWLHNRVDQVPETGTGERRGNQLLFSVRYDF